MARIDRYSPMEDRAITVRQFDSMKEALAEIQAGDPDAVPGAIRDIHEDAQDLPANPEYGPVQGEPDYDEVGVPDFDALTIVTAASQEALAPGVEVTDKHIIGEYHPTHDRVHRRCLFEGTQTPGTVTDVSGTRRLTTVTAPAACIDTSDTLADPEFYQCTFRHAKKLLNLAAGGLLDACHLYDGGEDLVHSGYTTGNITVRDSILELTGNLAYHSELNYSLPQMHSDLIQVRGAAEGVTIRVANCRLVGINPGDPGGPPAGQDYDSVNAAIICQTGDAGIETVEVEECRIACSGSWSVYVEDKNYGPVQNWSFIDNSFEAIWGSGAVRQNGGSGVATGNVRLDTDENIDSLILNGGW